MKCYTLTITGTGKKPFDLLAGMRVWTASERPAIVVGRVYELGNIFSTSEVVKGKLVDLSNGLIETPEATSLNRLIKARFNPSCGGSIDVETGVTGDDILLNLLVEGYWQIEVEPGNACQILKKADGTLHGAYHTNRAHGALISIAEGGTLLVRYGLTRKVVTTRGSENVWHFSHWFPQQDVSWAVDYHDFIVSYDGKELSCQLKGKTTP